MIYKKNIRRSWSNSVKESENCTAPLFLQISLPKITEAVLNISEEFGAQGGVRAQTEGGK